MKGKAFIFGKNRLLIGVIILLFLGQIQVQKMLSQYQTDQREAFLYLPSGAHLKPLVLGYNQVVSDLLWIKTVGYFGSHFMTDKEYPWLYHILTLIIDLDPRFDFPYYFGGIVLSLEAEQVENANRILERGIEAYPEKWEYPFYIGFNHYYHQGDPLEAVPYIERAAVLPGAPEFVKSLIGTLYAKTNQRDTALKFFREAYENTKDKNIRKKIAGKIETILSEKDGHADRD